MNVDIKRDEILDNSFFQFGVLSGSMMFSAEMETIRRKNRIQRNYRILAMYLPLGQQLYTCSSQYPAVSSTSHVKKLPIK